MFLNVLKGAYPGLNQVDKTLPMKPGESIERGSLMKINASSQWELATDSDAGAVDTPGAYLYVALMAGDDLVAGMAGNVGSGVFSAATGNPQLTGLALSPSMQIETDMFTDDSNDTFAVGDFCAVGADGKFVKHADDKTAIARVDAVPAARWVNNAVAVTGWRTGANVSVITLTTMYIPNLSTATNA